jgi:hypothetical protein
MFPRQRILSFHSLGNRNYNISYLDENGIIQNHTKVKGLSLTSHVLSNTLTPELFSEYVESSFQNYFKSTYLPQFRQSVSKLTKEPNCKLQSFQFSNELFVKRFVLDEIPYSYVTWPYGYKFP